MCGTTIFTVGHSTVAFEEFLAALRARGVIAVADVRRYPASRRQPHFGAARLRPALAEAGIAYRWFEQLGGRREATHLSLDNAAWRVAAFHAYADWMRSADFRQALAELEDFARAQPTAVMCAEALWTRCHRRLIADALVAHGWTVAHILLPERLERHVLPDFARIAGGEVGYPLPILASDRPNPG